MKEVNLDAPAFGPGSQKPEELVDEPIKPVGEEVKVKEEEAPVVDPVEENKVPYSRFKKFHDEAVQLRQEAAEWKAKAEAIRPAERQVESEIPSFWKEMYGDSDASQRAWQIQSEQNEAMLQKARDEAKDAYRQERYEEIERQQKNVEAIDTGLETLKDFVGRDLTEKEQAAVLDIVDDFTPKGQDGSYNSNLFPFEKAWEIYELKSNAQKAPKKESRDNVAALTGRQTQGEPTINEKDKDFNPMDWGAWRNKL